MEEARFRQWEQHLIAERDRLNKDLEQAHRSLLSFFWCLMTEILMERCDDSSIKTLEVELDTLGGGQGYSSTASRQTGGRR